MSNDRTEDLIAAGQAILRDFEALLTTLSASTHPWIVKVYRNANAHAEKVRADWYSLTDSKKGT